MILKILPVLKTFNMTLLDSGCTKTVCGEMWLQHYLQSLSQDEYKQVVHISYNNF